MRFEAKRAIFKEELKKRKERIYQYLMEREERAKFQPQDISEAVQHYLNLGGKSLRPAVLLFSCGVVGGDEEIAIPAAAAVEVYHLWTLVHDDLIDKDEKRRGGLTVHQEFYQRAFNEFHLPEPEARHYGAALAILAGDLQQGWTIFLLTELFNDPRINSRVVSQIIRDLGINVQSSIIEGETLDVRYSKLPLDALNEEEILKMLELKTGALYGFAGRAGAMIGLNVDDPSETWVNQISQFARKCGTAFQLKDDVLGIIGDEEKLGKPVGSDIREGKKTIPLCHAYKKGTAEEKKLLAEVIGHRDASAEEVEKVVDLLKSLGGIEYTQSLARSISESSLTHLMSLPSSPYRELLATWAEYIIEREY